jgi:hypothetical protein
MILALVNNIKGALLKIVVIFALLGGLFLVHTQQVNTAVNKAIVTQKAEYDRLNQSLQTKSLVFECSIKDDVTSITKEKDAKIKDITRKYNAALDSLRQYSTSNATSTSTSTSSNTTTDSSNAKSTAGVVTEGLFADHAEVSLGVAKNAEELKQHLNACYQQYDTVKDQLDSYRK